MGSGAGAKDGSGASLMGFGTKVGSGTGAPLHCRGERMSSESLRTGAARPRAERRPKAVKRLRLYMMVLCNRGSTRCFALDLGRAPNAQIYV